MLNADLSYLRCVAGVSDRSSATSLTVTWFCSVYLRRTLPWKAQGKGLSGQDEKAYQVRFFFVLVWALSYAALGQQEEDQHGVAVAVRWLGNYCLEMCM